MHDFLRTQNTWPAMNEASYKTIRYSDYATGDRRIEARFEAWENIFLFSIAFRPALVPIQNPIYG
jgi:hypothetical protein